MVGVRDAIASKKLIKVIKHLLLSCLSKGTPPVKKNVCFQALPELPLPLPRIRQLVPLFLDVKNNVLARITERSKDDYDNDVSDNCYHNFGAFDDFGVKNDQKVSNNMILMSKYKGKHGGKKGQKIRAWVDPPPSFGQCPKENVFFQLTSSLRVGQLFQLI